jgi:hypothetical protein
MPAHAQVPARTVGLNSARPASEEGDAARTPRVLGPRVGTIESERKVIAYFLDQTAATGYKCTTLQEVADAVGVTKEALRLRVDTLRSDGRMRREPCWCATVNTPHVRFFTPSVTLESLPPPPASRATPAASPALAASAEHAAAAASKQYAAVRMAPAVAGRQLRQLLPAQPDTWALFRVNGSVWRDPVVAWGVWEEMEGHQLRSVSGPLVFGGVELEPASASPGYVGVRIGSYRCLDGNRSFDDAKALEK